jgi:hypothetical protein
MAKRRRREQKQTEFDLTPMIDVTFQLLIFFIIAMKFKQIERRHGTQLPMDEGPNPIPADAVDRITLRLNFVKESRMLYYAVDVGKHNSLERGENLILGGNLADLMNDRITPNNPHYTRIFDQLKLRLNQAYAEAGGTDKVEIAMASDTTRSSALQIGDTAPWGFVTLAVDACYAFNRELESRGQKRLGITFKNTEPQAAVTR